MITSVNQNGCNALGLKSGKGFDVDSAVFKLSCLAPGGSQFKDRK